MAKFTRDGKVRKADTPDTPGESKKAEKPVASKTTEDKLKALREKTSTLSQTVQSSVIREEEKTRAESPEPMLQFFVYAHLPPDLAMVSAPFSVLANHIVKSLPRNPERTVALRKILEGKDCAVRAKLYVKTYAGESTT